ncbi:MAG: hypothetical protein PHD48_11200 [Alphaproteobacteria bacterium]|nr:hypothetical protein [Alphaproteobacteria bacterium]
MESSLAARLAKSLVLLGLRNTSIEDFHAGTEPFSEAGDYSDVKVVTPRGEIPWAEVSRISNDEMRTLMKEAVNKVYTILLRLEDPAFVERMEEMMRCMTYQWDDPENLTTWFTGNGGKAYSSIRKPS